MSLLAPLVAPLYTSRSIFWNAYRRHPQPAATHAVLRVFPPKTSEASESLFQTIGELEAYKPSFVSVTYGAGGSTRELTHDLVVRIKKTTTLDPVPHLTCVCHTEAEIASILERYAQAGVSNILALGGDPPRNLEGYDRQKMPFSTQQTWFASSKSSTTVARIPTSAVLVSASRVSLRGILPPQTVCWRWTT